MTRSPWSTSGNTRSGKTGVSLLGRADGGHLAGHVGKAASSPASLSRFDQPMPDPVPRPTPVQGQPVGVIPDRRR
jgi:hypothetical protein